ncbi:MAG: outer membrane lipoprotein-sorting protein [Candidatus Cloacimonetes bacterium]|nr:outer membrane lipoprotein-sorting protein [Candidatus Cloacimonadota bacterium]
MKFIKIICIVFLISVPLFSQEFKEYKLGEKQQFEGNKIFDEMVQSIGAVDQIKTIRTIGTASQPMEFGTISFPVQVEVKFPGKLRIKFEDKEFIIDNDSGWLKYPQGFYENLPDKYISTISGNLNRNLIQITRSKTDFEIKLLGEKTVLERECYEIELVKDDSKITLFIDKKKKLPVQMTYFIDTKQIIRTYLEYKLVDGINYPIHTISTDIDNNLISEIVIETVEFNIKIEGF